VTTRIDTAAFSTTPSGGGLREVALLAYPVVLTQLARTAMGVVDSAMAGRLGAAELGAVGYGGIWMWTAACVFMGTATGVQTFVAQAHGAGDATQGVRWTWQGLYAVLPPATLGIALFALALPRWLSLLGPSPELQALTTSYLQARALGAPGLVVAMVLASYFRGLGDTHTPLACVVVANLLNAALDYGLIFGEFGLPRWGVEGAGAATAVAEWTYALLLAVAFWRRLGRAGASARPLRPERRSILRFARTSVPIGGQWVLEMLSFALFSTLVARMGDASMAATQALLMLLSLSFMQALGISVAASTLVGRYVGAGDEEAARRAHASSLRLGIGLALGVAALFLALPGPLLRIFSEAPEVLRLARPLLALGALFQLFDALGIVASGSLRGAGDTRWPFALTTVLAWLFFLPLAWTLGVGLGQGLFGAWAAATAWVALQSALLVRRFHSGAWLKARI
jgi:MATE family, multidrug efflux pump